MFESNEHESIPFTIPNIEIPYSTGLPQHLLSAKQLDKFRKDIEYNFEKNENEQLFALLGQTEITERIYFHKIEMITPIVHNAMVALEAKNLNPSFLITHDISHIKQAFVSSVNYTGNYSPTETNKITVFGMDVLTCPSCPIHEYYILPQPKALGVFSIAEDSIICNVETGVNYNFNITAVERVGMALKSNANVVRIKLEKMKWGNKYGFINS